MRAIWEGWVAFVEPDKSKKFAKLVDRSDKIIPMMPWERSLEKDKFLAPDFSSLEVLTFAGDRLPKGINIPNYYDIREKEGFKNVVFESKEKATNRSEWAKIETVHTLAESNFIHEFKDEAYKVQVAGHELFGHGSGKLLYRDPKTGKCPLKIRDPLKGDMIESCYEEHETYQTKFGDFSSSMEECRADLSGLYLAHFPEVYSVF